MKLGDFDGRIDAFGGEYYWASKNNNTLNCLKALDIEHIKTELQYECLGYRDEGGGFFPFCRSEEDVIKFVNFLNLKLGYTKPTVKLTEEEKKILKELNPEIIL